MKSDAEVAKQLDIEFDQLFSTETVYDQLDDRISKTREKKKSLLMVLTMPAIPLHNNAAELAARAKVRKRDVSLQTVTDKGTKANDTFMTIVQTAKKLGVSVGVSLIHISEPTRLGMISYAVFCLKKKKKKKK